MRRTYDIVVVGGGHAGIEAARAAARLGAAVALVTHRIETAGQMSCNPAVGGVGKGQIVREIDALGGVMGLAADATGIQFRMLNASKGPAVRGPRCQSDRHAYAEFVQDDLRRQSNLDLIEAEATDLHVREGRIAGVAISDGSPPDLSCEAVIVTSGTFLRGVMHCGERTWTGGRIGEPSADGLSGALRRCGLDLGRLKTGTCPRLAAGSIDYARCARQDGDDPPQPFSFLHDALDVEQIPCWLSATNEAIHDLVRRNFHRAPMYTGQIQAIGPRYCPSFETKIDRFPDKTAHQVFIEPEGRPERTDWVYVNGIATSLPEDVQDELVRLIPGLERAEIHRYGYAIEYDFAPPTQLTPWLETKTTAGLFLAGQVNGTTGYEEAAGQGLLAGLNAVRRLRDEEPIVLRRDQAYLGVMVDDLVTKGVTEPYRMFTSRAEHRLLLRADNADRRLTPLGRQLGLVGDERWAVFQADRQVAESAELLLRETRQDGKTWWEKLREPAETVENLAARGRDAGDALAGLMEQSARAVRSLAVDAMYAGYLRKQQQAVEQLRDLEAKKIPADLDYLSIGQLRWEAREKLSAIRPTTLGQALRVCGITPADVTVLGVHLAGRR